VCRCSEYWKPKFTCIISAWHTEYDPPNNTKLPPKNHLCNQSFLFPHNLVTICIHYSAIHYMYSLPTLFKILFTTSIHYVHYFQTLAFSNSKCYSLHVFTTSTIFKHLSLATPSTTCIHYLPFSKFYSLHLFIMSTIFKHLPSATPNAIHYMTDCWLRA